jgi:hypothetical protein
MDDIQERIITWTTLTAKWRVCEGLSKFGARKAEDSAEGWGRIGTYYSCTAGILTRRAPEGANGAAGGRKWRRMPGPGPQQGRHQREGRLRRGGWGGGGS